MDRRSDKEAIGWVSGAAGIIVGSPLDVLKVKKSRIETARNDNVYEL